MMATHRIVCIYWLKAKSPSRHHHTIAVGTAAGRGHGARPAKTWSVDRALAAAVAGDGFVVGWGSDQQAVTLTSRPCPLCGLDTLVPDPPEAFDDLPECLLG